MKVRWLPASIVSLFLFVVPIFVQAQFSDFLNFDTFANSGFGTAELAIQLSPSHPEPGATVEASINDFSSSLYGSSISWVLNGEVIPSAANQRTVNITAPAIGESSVVEVLITTPNGQTQTLNTTITPTYLDIILEPQTRVPDFYQGRALPSIGSMINATALTDDGSGVRTSDLVYTWRVGQQVIQNGPLRGGYKVSFPMPQGDEAVLSLRVTNLTGQIIADRAILVRSVMPQLQFYEVSALYGMKHTAITSDFSVIGNTATVRAEPYYLDSRIFNNPAIAEWELNNQNVSNQTGNPYEVTLQRTGTFGTTNLRFHVRDTKQVLQGARANLRIAF